ncbi:MAG: DUF2344 domain-containing protein [Chloroflexi bacterium]|nr:DUF2344 domain-containing protein [Chloroflexota bacterium]
MTGPRQRLRLTFARDAPVRYITHLDVMRMWERVLKRAALPLAYSEGFTPRPRIALAAPLAVGMTSECELIEVITEEHVPLDRVRDGVPGELPAGFRLLDVAEVAAGLPSLQSMVRAATYEVDLPDARDAAAWSAAIAEFLARESIPWEHMRGDEVRRYDLRPLVRGVALVQAAPPGDEHPSARLALDLRNDSTGTGRPEQVARALGVDGPPTRVHRTRLELHEPEIPALLGGEG